MTELFAGTATALITPFKGDHTDFAKLAELIDQQINAGIDALVIAGTTGEASTMPDEEHIEVIREAVKTAAGRVPIIAGAGSNDTLHGISLCRDAEKAGADALLLVTPYYNKTSQRGLQAHFRATAEAVNIPVVLYNVPSRTSINIAPETYHELAAVENIVAIKECNFSQVAETMRLCGDKYTLYSGEDTLVVPMLSLGGKGVISVAANLVPDRIVSMTHAWLEGDIKAARDLQINLLELIEACFMDVSPMPVKAAMNLMGLEVGSCRLPLVDLTPQQTEKLSAVLQKYDLLKGN